MKKKKKLSHKPTAKKPSKANAKPRPFRHGRVTKKTPKRVVKKVVAKKKKQLSKPVKKTATKPVLKAPVKQKSAPLKKMFVLPRPVIRVEEPKPKGLYSVEYEMNSSPDVLFEFIATPGGLEKWFADRVYVIDGNFVFNWENGEKRLAKQVGVKEKEWVRYHWVDEADRRYFEFRIQIDDLTGEVALIVSDFADNPLEQEESTLLWNQQMHDLHYSIGSP